MLPIFLFFALQHSFWNGRILGRKICLPFLLCFLCPGTAISVLLLCLSCSILSQVLPSWITQDPADFIRFKMVALGKQPVRRGHWGHPTEPLRVCHSAQRHHCTQFGNHCCSVLSMELPLKTSQKLWLVHYPAAKLQIGISHRGHLSLILQQEHCLLGHLWSHFKCWFFPFTV